MPRQLTKDNSLWALTYISCDDGHRQTRRYFTTQEAARNAYRHERLLQSSVVQAELWKADDGDYYEVTLRRVGVDVPSRDDVLKKLTPQEREALGF